MEFKSILDFIQTVPDEISCIQYLEDIRWSGNIVSPFDETSKIYKCKNGYKCKNTGKYFNVKVGTIFEDTKIPLQKWFMALYIFASHKKGISSYQLAKDISVTQKSAWFMLHRLRKMFELPAFKQVLSGTVEADCTFIGGKNSNMHKSKRDKNNENGTGAINKTPVFGMIEREGNLVAGKITKEDKINVQPILNDYLENGTLLVTDGHGAYKGTKFTHEVLQHEQGEYARNHYHTANIDGFWSQLKRGIVGIYHQVSPKHVNSYVQEFSLRYNTRKMNINSRFDLILTNMENRLTYKSLIA